MPCARSHTLDTLCARLTTVPAPVTALGPLRLCQSADSTSCLGEEEGWPCLRAENVFPEKTLTGKFQEREIQRPQGAGLLLDGRSLNRF